MSETGVIGNLFGCNGFLLLLLLFILLAAGPAWGRDNNFFFIIILAIIAFGGVGRTFGFEGAVDAATPAGGRGLFGIF